jgi:type II secretory pathway pseudopilin PulG
MRRNFGATLVEMLVGMVMVVVLTIATLTLYSYTAQRVASAGGQSAVQMQVNLFAAEITKMVSQAKSCRIATNGSSTALVCEMPASGTDQDYDGALDHFTADGNVDGRDYFDTGNYVWFYTSDDSGVWGRSGTKVWRAIVPGSGNPAPSNVDANWGEYYGGPNRWNLIDNVTFTCDVVHQTTTFSVTASSLDRADRSLTTDPNSRGSSFSGTWTVFWKNYRNMLVNGSFERPDVTGTGWNFMMDDHLNNGWVATNGQPFAVVNSGNGCVAFQGGQFLQLDLDTPSAISQTVTTEPGKTYQISFYYSPYPGCSSNRIEVKWNGATVAILDADGGQVLPTGAWALKTYLVQATDTSADLEFIDESTSGDAKGGLIDTVVVMPK